ncbi:MAG: hypothetical protein ACLFRO_08370, partial [Desulfobacterales bacterium]
FRGIVTGELFRIGPSGGIAYNYLTIQGKQVIYFNIFYFSRFERMFKTKRRTDSCTGKPGRN